MQHPPSSSCRICGVTLSNDTMLTHELTCLQTSQEQLNTKNSADGKNNNSNLNKGLTSRNQQMKPEDSTSIPIVENEVINVDSLTPSTSSAIPLPQISEVEEDEDQLWGSNTGNPSSSVQISEIEEDDDEWGDSTMDNSSSSVQISEIDEDEETYSTLGNPGSSKQNTRKNSLVTPTFRYDRKKPKNLFPPTKKYHYYPVTCDYCQGRFQPNELKAHQKKEHFKEPENKKFRRRTQSTATRKGFYSKAKTRRKSSTGGMMGRFQFCYICGQMYGSKSIKIHEPQCLKKWRIQNDQLPPELKAPEPVKPEPLMPVAGEKRYSVPGHDPAVEAAFQSHLSSLIRCKYCSRTFSPDRIQRHMSCCIDRPKGREYVTPTGGEIPR